MKNNIKIVHLCLGCFYVDNYSYQENLLPKFHKELGYDVEIVATERIEFDSSGLHSVKNYAGQYWNEFGIRVTRLKIRGPVKIFRLLKMYKGTYQILENVKPDILFIHGCQFADMNKVVRYLKNHREVIVYVDNHADFRNSAKNFLSKNILHKVLWKKMAHEIEPYTDKFYGVLPARVDFLKEVYKLPEEKCELLVLGADDEIVLKAKQPQVREEIRKKYFVAKEDLLLVTGGKIDENKPEIMLLMRAVIELTDPHLKLLFFGSVSESLKRVFNKYAENEKIINAGWIKSDKAYEYFNAADVIVFPGLHSVMWEQAVAMGKPCLFRKLEGFQHVDLGGNCLFMDGVSCEDIKKYIIKIMDDSVRQKLKKAAEEKGLQFFSYREIAKRAVRSAVIKQAAQQLI